MTQSVFAALRRARPVLTPALLAALVLPLAACLGPVQKAGEDPPQLLRRAALAEGDVVVVPPAGFCIDRASLQQGQAGGFALLARCEALGGYASGAQMPPVVMTVATVARAGNGGVPTAAELAHALEGQQVIRDVPGEGLALVEVQSVEAPATAGDPRHWRAFMRVNDWTVGLALYHAKGSAAGREEAPRLMRRLAEIIRDQSADASPSASASATAAQPGNARPVARPAPARAE